MRCPCTDTWKFPCRECYAAQLKARAEQLDGAPASEELGLQLQKAGVPGSAIADLATTLKVTPALDAAKKFARSPRGLVRTLALLGPAGRGKTVAAAWVMREKLRVDGWNNTATGTLISPVLFVDACRLTRVSNFDALDSQWLSELERVDVLVLDDAGDEGTAQGAGLLSDLARKRHGKQRRTVITSNLTKDAFERRYGNALTDRIKSEGILAELPGVSMRKRVAA